METDQTGEPGPITPGWKTLTIVGIFYLGCLGVATWPAFATFGSTLPSRVDPLAHIWTMRWNKDCLLHGRLPFVCPGIQYPVGASLGTLPPMHFQTLLFVPLSLVFGNDILCYNLIRTFAFLLTGLGTFLLIWNILRSRMAATLGGLTAMLGGPMTFFSHGELEQITVGWFPIFLIAWLRWVDRPSRRGLAASVALYALVAMSAPYFGIFAIFPAALYVAWRAIGEGRVGIVPWLKARLGWFATFAGLIGPLMIVLFSNQIWALTHGFSMSRPESEFWNLRAPLWGFLTPSPVHLLSRWMPFDTNVQADFGSIPSYLGVATIALILYAAAARVRFGRRAYWWAVFALLLTLSLGAHARIGSVDFSLPAYWLKKYFVGFRMIRVPARFNLFASVAAAVVAAAGLKHLLGKIGNPSARVAAFSAILALTLVDLSTVPYPTIGLPTMPACYQVIRKADPDATFLDAPQFNSGAFQLPSLCSYWQSIHGGRTSAGYTAFDNLKYDNLLYFNSPFDAFKLANPAYPMTPEAETIELATGVDFRSYAWLYLKVHDLRYVVLHQKPGSFPEFVVHLDRLKALLQDSKIYEDADTVVYDRDKMPQPTKPVFLYTEGWGARTIRANQRASMVGPTARVLVYNPTPDQPMSLALNAASNQKKRSVKVKAAGRILARWQFDPTDSTLVISPSFRLPSGLQELTIESEGADAPPRRILAAGGSPKPFSLWVSGVSLVPGGTPEVAVRPEDEHTIRDGLPDGKPYRTIGDLGP
ncbi:hypothetical protein P12x_003154 [Tundrisphaera lichenicola]|uniref:hypothetical protein n=1 Tax=Tundrisphaera lichenicola TaxID=2029860 RepID=UPI003EBB26CD